MIDGCLTSSEQISAIFSTRTSSIINTNYIEMRGGVNDIWLTPKRYEELGGDEKFSLL